MRPFLPILLCALPVLSHADYEAGVRAHERGDYRRALAELVPAADGDARAALLLADMFERGTGVERDAQQALLWQRRAAELGDAQAQFALAQRYLEGSGVPAQPREAALWLERAAQQGHTEARFALGRMLAEGRGVPADSTQGRALIEQAAADGSSAAQAWLGWPREPAPHPPVVAEARSAPAPEPERSPERSDPGEIRSGPDIRWHWGAYRGWGSGAWYGFNWHPGWGPYGYGAHPWGWYPYGWYPYGWYPYGHPGSGVHFGFGFSN